ncbi:unnamed protein product [Staurois parvus]|uniref:Uncharacterized protein n=1 Tax=Staurois parvus TaxID=386267 RepID=A0ABN9F6D3_9NEOB|nr:unnamed protein product [Staurois parvus]
MESNNYNCEFGSPPKYSERGYEQLKEEMETQNQPMQHFQSTVVTIMPEEPPVRDHIIWSLFNAMYMNFCCLGFLSPLYFPSSPGTGSC